MSFELNLTLFILSSVLILVLIDSISVSVTSLSRNTTIVKSTGEVGYEYYLLEMIKHDSTLTILEMAEILKVSRETVKRLLKKLKVAGMLVREGGTRGYWRLLK